MIIINKKLIFSLLIILGILFSLYFININLIASNSNKTYLIYIDPGHGGFDGGCTSKDNKYIEKDITLNISLLLSNYLRSSGFVVKLTRESDIALANTKKEDIYKRVKLINNSNAILFISIHVNSYPSSSVRGAQVFYSTKNTNSKTLANIIMNNFHMIDNYNKRSALAIKNKYLMDNVIITGCLIEAGFLTNDTDLLKLTNTNYVADFVKSIYLGIIEYLDYLK